MKNKNLIRICTALLGAFCLIPFTGSAQKKKSSSSSSTTTAASTAVIGYTTPVVTVIQTDQVGTSLTGTTNFDYVVPVTQTDQVSTGFSGTTNLDYLVPASQTDQAILTTAGVGSAETFSLSPYKLALKYEVPVHVFLDWSYLQRQAANTMADGNSFWYNPDLQASYEYLAWTGFNSYSEHKGIPQKMEVRRGVRTPYKYIGNVPPIVTNTNPAFKIITFTSK